MACRYDELAADAALNRVLKTALVCLKGLSRAQDTQRTIGELLQVYDEVRLLPRTALPWHEIVLDRSNSGWRDLLGLARLLLGSRFQTTSAGETRGFALLFEMNMLFEEFVGRALRRALGRTDARVTLQGPRAYALHHPTQGHRLFATRPDIVVTRENRPILILDTKWKRLTGGFEDRRRGVAQADVYQMMAYAQIYGCRRLVLVYPHHAGLLESAGCMASYGITNHHDSRIALLTVDLTNPASVPTQLQAAITLDDALIDLSANGD